MQQSLKPQSWRLKHSIWIVWTFVIFCNWVAFAYIGIRARRSRWTLYAFLYALPLLLAMLLVETVPQWLFNSLLTVAALGNLVAIVNAFWIRNEYLLRLEMQEQQHGTVSTTTRGRMWEWQHSIWILWTSPLTLFFTNWIGFFYIGVRARRLRWILWGIYYFSTFLFFALSGTNNPVAEFATGLFILSGAVSFVHALTIRLDYLITLENRLASEAQSYVRPTEVETPSFSTVPPSTQNASQTPAAPPQTERITEQPERVSETPLENQDRSRRVPETAPAVEPISTTEQSPFEYPLPLAYSWSMIGGLWDPRDRYREQFRHAENMLAYLGSITLALMTEDDLKQAGIDLREAWQGGISFGGWKLLVQRGGKALANKDHPIARSINRLKIGSENKGFGFDVARIISMRNDFHHGRGPQIEEEISSASTEVQAALERCMNALGFLSDYPLRLIQDFDLERNRDDFSLKCLKLMGTGPGFTQEKIHFPRILPKNDVVLDLGDAEWISLYPYVAVSNCPHCRYRETYYLDRWNDRKGTTGLKSFERGHADERSDTAAELSSISLG